jgi:hypothetical protein
MTSNNPAAEALMQMSRNVEAGRCNVGPQVANQCTVLACPPCKCSPCQTGELYATQPVDLMSIITRQPSQCTQIPN